MSFMCEYCDFSSTRKATVQRHELLVHQGMDYVYKCAYCQEALPNLRDYLNHTEEHSRTDTQFTMHRTALNNSVVNYRYFFPRDIVTFEQCFSNNFFSSLIDF